MKKLKKLESAYVRYTKAMIKLHAQYYPTADGPLVGSCIDYHYLNKWGKITDRWKKEEKESE
jgi:hypothetical protein